MSMFKMVEELRSRGVPAQLAAWYPSRTAEGKLMCDSMAIIVLMDNVTCDLCCGADLLDPRVLDTLDVHISRVLRACSTPLWQPS